MPNQTILQALNDFSIDLYRPIFRRDLDLGEPLEPRAGNLVKVVTGMRRSGKSYRLLQEMDALHERGIGWERMFYFNFEDDRLRPITSRTGDELLEAILTLCPDADEQGIYLFLDELQEMDGWGSWMRRLIDRHRLTVYVSGSSSKMLSTEISTEFRGRALDFELLPYSFSECVRIASLVSAKATEALFGNTPANTVALPTPDRIRLQQALESYLAAGGFPAALGLPRAQSTALLQSYVQRVVARDIVERHDISRLRVASLFAQRALALNAKPLSIRKLEGDLRGAGLKTSRELLAEVASYCEEAYLLFLVRGFSYSQRMDASTERPKVYAIDPGLAMANARANAIDEGQRLEDAVYLELRRRRMTGRRAEISSYKTREHGWEVDFVTGDATTGEAYSLYQVCADVSDERTFARETRSLWKAMHETGLGESTLLVLRGERQDLEQEGCTIHVVPAWQWLLER